MRNAFTPDQLALIEALESGEYKQGKGRLCRDGKFCCLGVATHLKDPNHAYLKEHGFLADELVSAYHLTGVDGDISEPWRGCGALSRVNDNGATFAEIAAFMREKPWAVFTNFDAPE